MRINHHHHWIAWSLRPRRINPVAAHLLLVLGIHAREDGSLDPEKISEDTVTDHLYTAGLPDPDLLIRTAGEMRLSNYLLWQISYAEIYVTDICWPEFDVAQLHKAFEAYAGRKRKFGAVL